MVSSSDALRVEVTEDYELAVEQHQLVQQIGQLFCERRRNSARRSVDASGDNRLRSATDQLHCQYRSSNLV